jgi:hypothetical protein
MGDEKETTTEKETVETPLEKHTVEQETTKETKTDDDDS